MVTNTSYLCSYSIMRLNIAFICNISIFFHQLRGPICKLMQFHLHVCRVASSDSNLYSLLRISVSTVVNVVGCLFFVSWFRVDNLYFSYFSLVTTDNLYFSYTKIVKKCSSHIFHGTAAIEDPNIYIVQKNQKSAFYVKTWISFLLLFQLLRGFEINIRRSRQVSKIEIETRLSILCYFFIDTSVKTL